MHRYRPRSRSLALSLLTATAALGSAAAAHAAPLDPAKVPADAKWVMHVDLERVVDSRLVSIVREKMPEKQLQKLTDQLNAVDAIAGMKLREDLTDATLFSRGDDEDDAVLVLTGNLNTKQLTTLLKANKGYAEETVGGHTLMTWADKKKDSDDDDDGETKYGAFAGNRVAVVGSSKSAVREALEVIDGKRGALDAASSKLAPPDLSRGAGVLFYAAADAVQALQDKARSPIVSQISSGWMSLSESSDGVSVRASVVMKTPESAQQMRTTLEGLRALASLAVKDGDETAKAALNVVQAANLSVSGASVKLDWPIGFDVIGRLAEKAAVKVDHDEDDDDDDHEGPTTKPTERVKVKVKVGD